MKLFLIGFMGCGKSSIGKRLAATLGYKYIDTDSFFEERFGKTVSDFFQQEGEAKFREHENLLLKEVANDNSTSIVSTGGGTPCFFNAMSLMNSKGCTIYIQLTPSELIKRLHHAAVERRPLLKGKSDDELFAYISQLLQQREPIYKQAQLVVDGTTCTAETLATQLYQLGIIAK